MKLARVREIPSTYGPRELDSFADGADALLKAKMLASLSHDFDCRLYLTERYGPPDVTSPDYSWRFIVDDSYYLELRMGLSTTLLFDRKRAKMNDINMALDHFISVFTEESKSVWTRKSLDMKRVLPYPKSLNK